MLVIWGWSYRIAHSLEHVSVRLGHKDAICRGLNLSPLAGRGRRLLRRRVRGTRSAPCRWSCALVPSAGRLRVRPHSSTEQALGPPHPPRKSAATSPRKRLSYSHIL